MVGGWFKLTWNRINLVCMLGDPFYFTHTHTQRKEIIISWSLTVAWANESSMRCRRSRCRCRFYRHRYCWCCKRNSIDIDIDTEWVINEMKKMKNQRSKGKMAIDGANDINEIREFAPGMSMSMDAFASQKKTTKHIRIPIKNKCIKLFIKSSCSTTTTKKANEIQRERRSLLLLFFSPPPILFHFLRLVSLCTVCMECNVITVAYSTS